jgi:hypothetical protein
VQASALLLGTISSEIRIVLETAQFTAEGICDFEAWSYTWGGAENPSEILICATGNYCHTEKGASLLFL